MMTIEHFGRGVFHVTSRGETWTVDVLRRGGIGECDCWRGKAVSKQLREEGVRPGEWCKCPHITFADKTLLEMFKKELILQYPDTQDVT
jgi:hypothetical protein